MLYTLNYLAYFLEGREKGTGDLPLTYSIKWTDLCNQYGADTASLSISFEEEHSFQDLDDLVLSSAVPTLSSGRRAQLGIKKASLLFQGYAEIY